MPTAAPPPEPLPEHLYKILPRGDFFSVLASTSASREAAEAPSSSEARSALPDDVALPSTELDQNDGFVHLSTRAQVGGVLGRFFNGPEQAEIVLVRIDYAALVNFAADTRDDGARVQWDQAGAGVFAHLYGADLFGSVVRGWRVVRRTDDAGWESGLKAVEQQGWFVD